MRSSVGLVTIEGCDGVGKSTHLKYIQRRLQEHFADVVTTKEPGGTPLGESLRSIMLNAKTQGLGARSELMMMFAARAEHIEQIILPVLARGGWVLSDRYIDASFAYQGGGRQLGFQAVAELEIWLLSQFGEAAVKPALTLLFDAPLRVCESRTGKRRRHADRFEQESRAFKSRVKDAYLRRAASYPQRIRIIDANQDISKVAASLDEALERFFEDRGA